MKKVLIFLICLIGYQIGCHAQMADEHYYFKNLSVQNGLSQNTVNAILQDRQGFMWFGTKDGLNRYDPHRLMCLNVWSIVSGIIIRWPCLSGHGLVGESAGSRL